MVILILGAGIMQIPAIRTARQKGWKVYVADVNKEAPGRKYADEFLNIDIKDKPSILEAAERIKSSTGLDGVFTAGTDFSTTVAWVAEKLRLPGIPYSVSVAATDKSLMREIFRKKGVPSPDFVYLSQDENINRVVEMLKFPMVVKPVDNMGARGVRRVDDIYELKTAVKNAWDKSRIRKAIVESYISGPELSLDALVYKNKITICGIADRHIHFPPYFVEMGHTMPTKLAARDVKAAADVFKLGIRALGIDNGAAKGDIKVTATGAVVGEIAARLSGGYMSGWTFPYSSGVSVTGEALNIAVGLEPGNLKPVKHNVSAERAFISIPGRVKNLYGIKKAGESPYIKDLFLRISVQDTVNFPTNNVEKCGNVISMASDHASAVSSAEKAVQKIFIRLEPGNEETESFLFPDKTDKFINSTWALKLERKENINALKGMKPFKKHDAVNIGRKSPISILALPQMEYENGKDWHGARISYLIKRLTDITDIRFISAVNKKRKGLILGSLFWNSFLKGGLQGGVYILDTVNMLIKEGRPLDEYFNRVLK